MNVNVGKRLFQSAVILTLAALLTKAISIGYRIPYQNIAGDIGFYIYQQVYPVHGIAFTLAMYGFPVVISKMIAEQAGSRQQVLTLSFLVLMIACAGFFALFFIFSPLIARFVGDEALAAVYRTIAFAFLFVPMISVLRGFFQAEEQALPTAISQVFEQLIRVAAIVLLAFYFIQNGSGVYAAGAGAAFGSIAGGAASVFALLFFYIRRKRVSFVRIAHKQALNLAKQLFAQGFAISIGALAFIFFQLIDAMTVLKQLQQSGYSFIDAKILKGVYDRGQPLLQLGFALATSLSLVAVPAIASAAARKDRQEARQKAGFALKVTFVISLAASLGLAVIIEPTNVMLFKDSRGSTALAVLGAAIFFGSLALVSIAILQGVDRVKVTVVIVAAGLFVKAAFNVFAISMYGIYAAAAATVAGFAVMAVLSLYFVQKQLQLFSHYPFRFVRAWFAAVGMAAAAVIWQRFAQAHLFGDGRLGAAGTALSTVAMAMAVYFSLLFVLRVFTRSELGILLSGKQAKTNR